MALAGGSIENENTENEVLRPKTSHENEDHPRNLRKRRPVRKQVQKTYLCGQTDYIHETHYEIEDLYGSLEF